MLVKLEDKTVHVQYELYCTPRHHIYIVKIIGDPTYYRVKAIINDEFYSIMEELKEVILTGKRFEDKEFKNIRKFKD